MPARTLLGLEGFTSVAASGADENSTASLGASGQAERYPQGP